MLSIRAWCSSCTSAVSRIKLSEIPELFSLKNRKAVVLGGAGVLGSTIAAGLGRAGATVVIADRQNYEAATARLTEAKIDARGLFVDALDRKSLEDVAGKVGRVDILVNAVGGNMKEATTSPEKGFFDLPREGMEKVMALNLLGGAILPCQAFGRVMAGNPEGGSIINISSMNALRPLTRIPGYSAAKAAVSNFTQWLAVHIAQEHNKELRVNAIAPGFFLTEQNRFLLTTQQGELTDRGKTIIAHTPLGRFGEPDELVGVCVWLASDASRFVTGTVVVIDGGFNAFSGV